MLRHGRLRTRLAIMIAGILVLAAAADGVLVHLLNRANAGVEEITSKRIPSAAALRNIDSSVSDLRSAQLEYAFHGKDADGSRLRSHMALLIEKIETNRRIYEALIDGGREAVLYERFETRWGEYLNLSRTFLDASLDNRHEQANQLLSGEAQVVFNDTGAILDELVRADETALAEIAARADEAYLRAKRISLLTLIAVIAVAVAFTALLARFITRPVEQLAAAARRVADGDLDVRVDVVAGDEIGALSASLNAMTESLREAQRQLVMCEKMASLGNLVAGVAHEINNPVGAVKSAADTSARSIELVCRELEECADPEDIKNDKRFLTALDILKSNNEITVTASDRIADIVRSLKNFARADEAVFQEADLHEGLDSTLTLLHHELKNRVAVEKHYGDLPPVQCYPNQINQVFMNVLSNAEQAIPGEGTITITTEMRGDDVVVKISDDGEGIPAEELKRVFDPGFTTKGAGVGTGLGLSISDDIVRRHHGRIEAESAPGGGTTITISLPVRQLSEHKSDDQSRPH